MKKRFIGALLTAVMAASLLTGCGSQKVEEKKETEKTSTAKTEETKETKETEKAPEGGGTLVYWSMWSDSEPQAQVIAKAVEKYTADTGVKVDLQFKGRSGQREGLQPALDAKQQIDVFDEDVNRVNGSWGKYLLNIEDMAKELEASGSPVLYKIAREAHADGTLHSIPYQPFIFGFFYNQTLFEKAGITAAPKTWEEFDAVCAKLKEAGITPITTDDAYMSTFFGLHLARYIGQDGVESLVKATEVNGQKVTWDDPRVLAAAKSLADFAAKGYFSENVATNVYPAGQNQEFAPGDAAIVICGSWLPNEAKDSVADDLKWGYFNYPSVPNGVDGNDVNNIGGQVFAINKDSAMPNEALALIKYIVTGEFDKMMSEEALAIPADKNNTEWPAQLAGIREAMEATTKAYAWGANVDSNPDLSAPLKTNSIELIGGKIDGDAFVAAMKAAAGQ